MTTQRAFLAVLSAALTAAGAARADSRSAGPHAATAGLDTSRIEQLTGLKGALDPKEGVFKVTAPRTDLTVLVAGVHVTPPLGTTSWAAFPPAGGGRRW